MRVVTTVQTFPATVHEAETLWYDTGSWSSWVDGFGQVERVTGGWPQPGSSVAWTSGPAGRGSVSERVSAYEPLTGQTVDVEDDSIKGRQTVSFTPEDDGVTVELSLEYELKQRSLFTPLVDLLFIRSAFRNSIQTTLQRFGLELEAARSGGGR